MYQYTYNSRKPRHKVHIINSKTGRTFCSLENSYSFKNLNVIGENPADRPICSICQNQLLNPNKKNKKHSKSAIRKQKQKEQREVNQAAREGLIKYFGLYRYATNIAICLCIHKKTDLDLPDTDKETKSMMSNYWRHVRGKTPHKNYNYMSSKDFYSSKKWREVRYIVLQQSNGTCELCGARASDGVQLHVDHIKPRSKFPELQFNLDNLQVLCDDCNLGKSNYDDTDWRDHWETL